MAGLRPVIPPEVAEAIRHLAPDVKRAVRSAIRILCANPAAGEALHDELRGYWKYRVRRFRIVYAIDRPARALKIVALGHRRAIYEEVAELIRQQRK
jgi:mRNA interferase RelE/StbE